MKLEKFKGPKQVAEMEKQEMIKQAAGREVKKNENYDCTRFF